MKQLRRSFVVRSCNDVESDPASAGVKSFAVGLSFWDMRLSSLDVLVECDISSLRIPRGPSVIGHVGLLCDTSRVRERSDFEIDYKNHSGVVYLDRAFKLRPDVRKSEIIRLALARLVGHLLRATPVGIIHLDPSCIMQNSSSLSDLAVLAGVTNPFCVQCQNGIKSTLKAYDEAV